jgi:beta-lactamase class A
MVLRQIGGPAKVTETMRQLGLAGIRLDRTIRELLNDISTEIDPRTHNLDYAALQTLFDSEEDVKARFQDETIVRSAIQSATDGRDCATPREIARLYAQIATHTCASQDSCQAILKTLERQQLRTRLPRDLPANTRFCHKTGSLGPGTVCNDTGLLYLGERAIAVAVLSKQVRQEPALTNTTHARIGRAIYDYYASGRDAGF